LQSAVEARSLTCKIIRAMRLFVFKLQSIPVLGISEKRISGRGSRWTAPDDFDSPATKKGEAEASPVIYALW